MSSRINYQEVLNPAQLEAVMALEGPILVIAGAGSGKTRTLVYRVARLVETDIAPEAILLLTFTRKAAQEMLDRAAALSDPRCRFVSGGTFHSLAHRVLRNHAGFLGFRNTFTVMDRSDMEEVIQSLVPTLGVPKGAPRFPKKSTVANILSKAANLERPVDLFMEDEYAQFLDFVPEISKLKDLYMHYKKTHQLMDYDDLILFFRTLLTENEEVRQSLSSQYSHIMVDEYQDTNTIQSDIVKWLSQDRRNIMAVGDDAQSIYSFRGANYRNMFEFPKHFPEAKLIKLEENYRSTQPVLNFTNALMSQASEKFTKCLFTKRTGGELPRVVDTRTEPEQALFVCSQINTLMKQGLSITDIAVLFRAGYHSFELEAELTRQGIFYVKYGGFKFLESAHIKDFMSHLRVVMNRDDMVSWMRILRLLKNVGQAKSQAIIQWMKEKQIPAERISSWPGAHKGDKGLEPLSGLFSRLKHNTKPKKAAEYILEYYDPILKENFDDFPRRQKELDQLVSMASRYKKLRNFLDDLVLEPPTSSADLESGKKRKMLTLSTVHSAKGLEWPVVFVIWVSEGRFPPSRAYADPKSLEEERRLLYVASTRAKDQLILCYPGQEAQTSFYGYDRASPGFRSAGPSSFITTLPPDVISHEFRQGLRIIPAHGGFSEDRFDMKPSQDEHAEFSPGDKVRHPAFGPGVVSKFLADDKVEVLFRNFGRKRLHLAYTTLERA